MKQYTITQHPFKATLEFDDQWLTRFRQQYASEKMNGKPEPYPEFPE